MALDYRVTERHNATDILVIGSNDYGDWKRNLQFRSRDLGDGVHVNRVDRKEALKLIRQVRHLLTDTMIVRGHSRGGAIAQQAAWELRRLNYSVKLMLYGSKRTGNQAFVDKLLATGSTVSIRHKGDWVPYLPPWRSHLPWVVVGEWTWPWRAHFAYTL